METCIQIYLIHNTLTTRDGFWGICWLRTTNTPPTGRRRLKEGEASAGALGAERLRECAGNSPVGCRS